MAKWRFAAIAVALVILMTFDESQARTIPVEIDGCALLARIVHDEVGSAALYGPGNGGPWRLDPALDRPHECGTVTRTVSRAYTSAMTSAGYDVRWHDGKDRSGDHCFSMHLPQCYPNRDGSDFDTTASSTDFVQQTWSVVSQTVMRHMANPHSSDVIRFNGASLRLRLGLSLRTIGDP